jgi:hypothetical protein
MRSFRLGLLCGLALFAATLIACSNGGTITPAHTVDVPVTPIPIPTLIVTSPFYVAVTASAAPSVALPAAGGYSGNMTLGGSIQAFAQVDQTLQNTVPPGVAGLAAGRRAASAGAAQVLVYLSETFHARMPAYASPVPVTASPPASPTDPPNAPVGFSFTIPTSAQSPGNVYYLAYFDPLRPSLGWQEAFEGPAQNGSTLTFTGNSLTFQRYVQYWFALYVTSIQVHPTPAPSISPIPTPTAPVSVATALQAVFTDANSCSGSPCAAGPPNPPATPQPPIGHSVATGQTTPSLSQNSTMFTIQPDENHGDVLWYTPALAASPLATTFNWDFWFTLGGPLVTSPLDAITGPIESLEFDFNVGFPGYGYNFSSQCIFQGPNSISPTHWEWQIWGVDSKGGLNWVDSGIDCQPYAFANPAGSWHHIVWNYAIYPNTQQKAYLGLSIDGGPFVTPTLNDVATGSARPGDKQFVEVQYQMDARPVVTPAPSFSEWVDNVTLTSQ